MPSAFCLLPSEYLHEAERQAAEVRAEIDRRSNGAITRERLLARQAARARGA